MALKAHIIVIMMVESGSNTPPPGAAEDWTIPQGWSGYRAEDHHTWRTLYQRQTSLLPGLAAREYLDGLQLLQLAEGIPDFHSLSDRLFALTGWRVVAVPGLVPDAIFFDHLANRRFVAGNFIRRPDQLDYLQEPDVFHDIFGHAPLLTQPVFADFMQAYGQGGLRALQLGSLHRLARLYWHTVEFGLIQTEAGLRIYGAGILSSAAESQYALHSNLPVRLKFDLPRVMRTRYRIDAFQPGYFVIDSFEQLLRTAQETDFAPLYATLDDLPDLQTGEKLPGETEVAI